MTWPCYVGGEAVGSDQLLDVLDCTPIDVPVQRPTSDIHTFDTPVDEFDLTRIDLASADLVGIGGPAIVVITAGRGRLRSDTEAIELRQGDCGYIPSSDGDVTLSGDGTAYLATVG